MKKKKLVIEDNEFDFILIVIISYARDYRLCREINQMLNISLKRDTPEYNKSIAETNQFESGEMPSALFTFNDEERRTKYVFFANKTPKDKIINELKTTDYLLKIGGNLKADFVKKTVTMLRLIPMITMAYETDPQKFQSGKKLISI